MGFEADAKTSLLPRDLVVATCPHSHLTGQSQTTFDLIFDPIFTDVLKVHASDHLVSKRGNE